MTNTKQGRKIALVGASGSVGSPTLAALLSYGIHSITVIARPESTATFDHRVTVRKGSLDDEKFLTQALEGQEVLVLQLAVSALGLQDGFIRAAAAAGVKYILPTEWGSDPGAELVNSFPMLAGKRKQRRLVEDLGVSAWIAIVNNPWFDMSLRTGNWGIDVKALKATLWCGGDVKINTTTIARAGAATAEIISLPDAELLKYRNSPVFVTSFYINQREIFESVLRVTGTKESDWVVTKPSAEEIHSQCEQLKKSGNMWGAFSLEFYAAHFAKGRGGDYNDRVKKIFPEQEDLDTVVRAVVATI